MTIYLFRHGEKQWSMDNDPPLSPRGLEQSENLRTLIRNQKIEVPTQIFCSPKIRAQQTLMGASRELKLQLQIVDSLLEQKNEESRKEFTQRVKFFLEHIHNNFLQNEIVFLCTHFDWIEEFLSLCSSDTDLNHPKYQGWRAGQWMKFEITEGLWCLKDKGVL